MRAANQSDGVPQLVRVLKIERQNAADAFGVNIGRRDLLAESQRRQDRQLRARVVAIHVGARIGLGVAQPLRLFQNVIERGPMLLDFSEDVVAGAVEDAIERSDAVARNAFAQHRVNRDSTGHARFHRQIDAGRDRAIPNFGAAQRHQFFIGRDHRFLVRDGRVDDLARHRGAAHQFGDDIHFRMRHHLAPVRGAQNGVRTFCRRFTPIDRLHSAFTRNGNPSFSAICSAFSVRIASVPEPTFPSPMIPTFTSCI